MNAASVDTDPYQIFNIGDNFTYDQLKNRFVELLKKYDPVFLRPGVEEKVKTYNENMFNMVKKCYVTLKAKHFDKYLKGQQSTIDKTVTNKFDLDKFNEVFNNNRVSDVYQDSGYDNWMKIEADVKEKAIVNKSDPSPLMDSGMSSFYELGVEKINDFSGATESSLEFMDYKLAHSTTKLVDERYVKPPSYNSLKEIEAQRSSMSFQLSPQEAAYIKKQKVKQMKMDEQRMHALRKLDSISLHHHINAKKQMGVQ